MRAVASRSPEGAFHHAAKAPERGRRTDGRTGKRPGQAGATHAEALTSTGSGQRARAAAPKHRAYSVCLRLSCSSTRRWGTEGHRRGRPGPGPTRSGAWLHLPGHGRPPAPGCPSRPAMQPCVCWGPDVGSRPADRRPDLGDCRPRRPQAPPLPGTVQGCAARGWGCGQGACLGHPSQRVLWLVP